MPYISQDIRGEIDSGQSFPSRPGEINYAITKICSDYIMMMAGKRDYNVLNDVIGALECAKLECYRRLLAPLEDEKLIQNGDVY